MTENDGEDNDESMTTHVVVVRYVMQLDRTRTAKDRTSGLVFRFLRIKDRKKTGLYEPVKTG
jgi:hypothetical protein